MYALPEGFEAYHALLFAIPSRNPDVSRQTPGRVSCLRCAGLLFLPATNMSDEAAHIISKSHRYNSLYFVSMQLQMSIYEFLVDSALFPASQ